MDKKFLWKVSQVQCEILLEIKAMGVVGGSCGACHVVAPLGSWLSSFLLWEEKMAKKYEKDLVFFVVRNED